MNSSFSLSGWMISGGFPTTVTSFAERFFLGKDGLYEIFKNPDIGYRPYVRWWWLGNKVSKEELSRELRILKEAGIGGVEINPIAFPGTNAYSRKTDDMGVPTLEWLGDEWLEMLDFTFKEAASLDMTCDLIVGTGFPFGGEFVEPEDRSQIVVVTIKKFEGPVQTEFSLFDLYKEADPRITNWYTGRTMELLSVKLVPNPLHQMDEVIDLSDQIGQGTIKVETPKGDYALYALIKVNGFERVIVGTPGGMGPVVNHMDKGAVGRYLNRISDRIKSVSGEFPSNFRSFFVDSMELEGANWKSDMLEEFKKRRGYDITPYLPFILFKIGRMGDNIEPGYIADIGPELKDQLARMRYDWAIVNAEVFHDNYVATFTQWCRENGVQSRAQAYGRGYFLVEGGFEIDIPEVETWIKSRGEYLLGDDVPEKEFMNIPWDLGRGYTMVNKFTSSGARLKGKRLISSEELTHTQVVFNEYFETYKIGGDKSTISGVTQPIFHGFNYSPPDAPFPGWIIWGGAFSERMNSWPYLRKYTDYRSRLSALLQQGDLYADIALLAPIADTWAEFGAQNEPFPTKVVPDYQPLIWESIHQNGLGCDYVSERIIRDSTVKDGYLTYGPRKYHTLFLIEVESMIPEAARKLHDFVSQGGRIFCIEKYPDRYPGWENHEKRDAEVRSWVERMKQYPDRFILINRPEENFCGWFGELRRRYGIHPYMEIAQPLPHISQVRYVMEEAEVLFVSNSSNKHNYTLEATFSEEMTKGRNAWLWDAETGDRRRLKLEKNRLIYPLGKADSIIVVFDRNNGGEFYVPAPFDGGNRSIFAEGKWDIHFQHYNGKTEFAEFDRLHDLKDNPVYAHFGGTIKYEKKVTLTDVKDIRYLNLGAVHGISSVRVNGKDLGVQWYGNRIYNVEGWLENGENLIEVWIITELTNYLKSLKNNDIVQRWINAPIRSLGMAGPVSFY